MIFLGNQIYNHNRIEKISIGQDVFSVLEGFYNQSNVKTVNRRQCYCHLEQTVLQRVVAGHHCRRQHYSFQSSKPLLPYTSVHCIPCSRVQQKHLSSARHSTRTDLPYLPTLKGKLFSEIDFVFQ